MGARPYAPGLGRFLMVDPIEGGSANDYEYSLGDPVNLVDLDGEAVVAFLYLRWRVNRVANWSKDMSRGYVGRSPRGAVAGYRNALRHCLLAAGLAWEFGAAGATAVLEGHEVGRTPDDPRDPGIDRHNNSVGIAIGLASGGATEGQRRRLIYQRCTCALYSSTPWGQLDATSKEG